MLQPGEIAFAIEMSQANRAKRRLGRKVGNADEHAFGGESLIASKRSIRVLSSRSNRETERGRESFTRLQYRALLGRAYALAGEKRKALEILDELKALSQQRYVSPFDIAVVQVGLDDPTSAFQSFEEAYQRHVFRIIELTMPMYDSLRSDSRWQNLVRRIGLPQ